MYYLSKLCLLCLNYKEIESVLLQDDNGIVVQEKLQYCFPEITMLEPKIPLFICSPCRRTVHSFYEFKKTCLENYSCLMQYTQKLQETIDPRGQKFSELQIQIKKQNLLMGQDTDSQHNDEKEIEDSLKECNQKIDKIDVKEDFGPKFSELIKQMHNEELVRKQDQEVNSKLNIEMENEVDEKGIEDLLEEHYQLDGIDIKEEFEPKFTALQNQIYNQELMRQQEQEEDRKRKIEIYNKVLLQSLGERAEQPVVFNTVYVQENIIAPKNNEEDEFKEKLMKYKRVSDNEQSSTARNSCEDDNRLIVDKAKFSADSDNVNTICNKTHSDNKQFRRTNYKCTICKKYFLKQRYLTLHMKIHKNIRDFKCEICGMDFVQRTNLTRHLKIHDRRNEALLRLKEHEELLDELNIRELIEERKQKVNNKRKIEVTHEVTLPLKEHEEFQGQMINRELIGEQEQVMNNEVKIEVEDEISLPLKKHEEFQHLMNNRELIDEREQEMNNELKIEVEDEVLLKPLEKYEEKPIAFNTVYVEGNIVAPEKNKEDEFNKKHRNYERVTANEQGSTSRSSYEDDNLLVVSDSNSNTGIREFTHTDFKCTVCNKYFLKKRYLTEHLKIHNNIRNYKCEICGKDFVQRSHLKRHLAFHAKSRDFKCTICDKNFLRKVGLETHMKMHEGIRDFECGLCDKKFLSNSHLKMHMDRHIKEFSDEKIELNTTLFTTIKKKQLKCSICERMFIYQETLDKHMRVHDGILFFECSICNMKFANNTKLGDHMKNHRSNTSERESTEYVLGLE